MPKSSCIKIFPLYDLLLLDVFIYMANVFKFALKILLIRIVIFSLTLIFTPRQKTVKISISARKNEHNPKKQLLFFRRPMFS